MSIFADIWERVDLMTQPFYVTTPIYYVNDIPHVGHAYTTLAADTLARWHALLGADARFLTGTDEHGLKIEKAARESGITPQAHADHYARQFQDLPEVIGARPDDFIRTTETRHQAVVQEMWRRMEAAGDIYLDEYAGWYSVSDEAYFTEEELVNGKAPSGHEVEWMIEKSYFFRLSKYTEPLLAYYKAHPEFVQPQSRSNEITRFVEQGLRDISVSRTSFSWGVPVPDAEGHVIYVWVDALTNYISALGGPDGALYDRYWPHATHLIGKDILRFHTVYWPCFLMSAGLPLPRQIFAHGWWTVEGEKMSKSKGNAIDPHAAVEAVGADAFRYFLLREIPFGADGDFSESALIARINSDLANDYGNLLNRSLGMLKKYRASTLPASVSVGASGWEACEEALFEAFKTARSTLFEAMSAMKFHDALRAIWSLVSAGNKYVDSAAPWTLAKAGEERARDLDRVLYTLCEALRVIGVWTRPFLPEKSTALLDSLKVPLDQRTMHSTEEWGQLPGDVTVAERLALFPRIEGPLTLTRAQKVASTSEAQPAQAEPVTDDAESRFEPEPIKADIEYPTFAQLDVRVAVIIDAEKHPNADRLLKLTVDAGESAPRTVCAGIAAAYTPSELIGVRVALLANLKPRKLRGVISQGMILAAGEGEQLCLIEVPKELPPGTIIS